MASGDFWFEMNSRKSSKNKNCKKQPKEREIIETENKDGTISRKIIEKY